MGCTCNPLLPGGCASGECFNGGKYRARREVVASGLLSALVLVNADWHAHEVNQWPRLVEDAVMGADALIKELDK